MFKLQFALKLTLTTLLALGVLEQSTAIAQTTTIVSEGASSYRALVQNDWSFWPSEQNRAPRRTHSGSSRTASCGGDNFISLVPQEQIGLSGQARPEVLLYVPVEVSRQAVFVLQSGARYYHEAPIDLPETAGIISMPLPEEMPDLTAGERYKWSIVLPCNTEVRPDSPVVSGWLETQTSFDEVMSQSSPSLEQAARYRDNALWYDMIAMLAQLKIGHPDDDAIHQVWLSVLERHHLEDLSHQPILQ